MDPTTATGMKFWSGSRVEIHNVPGPLNGRKGSVVGYTDRTIFLVQLDEPYTDDQNFTHSVCGMPDVCLWAVS